MNHKDPLVLVISRNAFYKRLHFLALAALVLSVVVIITLVSVVLFLIKNPTQPLFFATDSIGRLIKIIPVNQPNMSTEEVSAWTVEAIQTALSYNYNNYRLQLQSAEKYFTNYGWTNYMKALTSSNNLPALTAKKMIVIAQATDKPKLVTQGILGGAYAWKFEIPVLVTYWTPPYDSTPASKFLNALQVSVIVQRQPILQSYRGLGIVQIIATASTLNQPQQLSGAPPG